MKRLERDLRMFQERFPKAIVSEDKTHLIIPDYELPIKVFNREVTRLLINISPSYPDTPPDNFFVELGLKTYASGIIQNYSEPVSFHGEQWGQFSFHVEKGGWDPSRDHFLTFITAIRSRLQEGA